MVCILSAFNGIEDLVKDLFGTLDADVALVPSSGAVIPEDWASLSVTFQAWSPGRRCWKMRWCFGRTKPCAFRRCSVDLVPPGCPHRQGHCRRRVRRGRFGRTDLRVLGPWRSVRARFAQRRRGTSLFSLSAPIRGRNLARQRERAFRTRGAHACGTFSINADLDTRYVIVPLDAAQELLDRQGSVSRFELKGAPGWSQERLAQSVMENLTKGWEMRQHCAP